MMSIPLPLCLFKFMTFPFKIDVDFKKEWKKNKGNLLTTEPLKINIDLIRNYEDILNIFPNAQFLNKDPNSPMTKWGIRVQLFERIMFQLKLIFFEKYIIIIQISSEESNSQIIQRIKQEILANIEFIFCQ